MDFFAKPPPKVLKRTPGNSTLAANGTLTPNGVTSAPPTPKPLTSSANVPPRVAPRPNAAAVVISTVKRKLVHPVRSAVRTGSSSSSSKPLRLNALPEEHWRRVDEEREAKASAAAKRAAEDDEAAERERKKRKRRAKEAAPAKGGKKVKKSKKDLDFIETSEEEEEEAGLSDLSDEERDDVDSDDEGARRRRKEEKRRKKEDKRRRKEKKRAAKRRAAANGDASDDDAAARRSTPVVAEGVRNLGRAGVLPRYEVPRPVCDAKAFEGGGYAADDESAKGISAAQVVERAAKKYGPFFFGLEEELPRVRLELPALNSTEEYILLAPRDIDEFDPISDLLSTIRTIVSYFVPSPSRSLFGDLEDLEWSGQARATLQRNADGALEPIARSSASGSKSPEGSATPNGHGGGSTPLHSTARSAILASATAAALANGSSTPPPTKPPSASVSPGSAVDTPASSSQQQQQDTESILRSLAKARNRHDGHLLVRSIERFNAVLRSLKEGGEIRKHLEEEGSRTGIKETVWKHVQEQCYARTVAPRVEELTKYEAFSDNVYGELLPRFMSEIAQLTSLKPGSVFVDLGSGVSNLLLQISLQTGADAFGIEQMHSASEIGAHQVEEAKRRWRMYGLSAGGCESWTGDFGEDARIRDKLREADVVIVNNYAFTAKTNDNLSLLFLDLKDGCQIVSLKPFVPADFRLTERTLSSPLAILSLAQRTYTSGCVSWAESGGRYYIHTVDRSIVARFLDSMDRAASAAASGGKGKRRRQTETSKRRWKKAVEDDDDEDDGQSEEEGKDGEDD